MDDETRRKKDEDLLFQEIGELEQLEAQARGAELEAAARRKSWFSDDVRKILMRKKFFRTMSREQQDEFVKNSIRQWRIREGLSD